MPNQPENRSFVKVILDEYDLINTAATFNRQALEGYPTVWSRVNDAKSRPIGFYTYSKDDLQQDNNSIEQEEPNQMPDNEVPSLDYTWLEERTLALTSQPLAFSGTSTGRWSPQRIVVTVDPSTAQMAAVALATFRQQYGQIGDVWKETILTTPKSLAPVTTVVYIGSTNPELHGQKGIAHQITNPDHVDYGKYEVQFNDMSLFSPTIPESRPDLQGSFKKHAWGCGWSVLPAEDLVDLGAIQKANNRPIEKEI